MSKPTRFDWLFRPLMADADLPLSAEARFAEALAELPAVERSALALSEIGGLDTDEIAERLGTDPAVVGRLLARARESVRASLSAAGRRGMAALFPLQSLWQLGSSAPAMRAAGVVAAVVVVPSVVSGGAAADAPFARVLSAGPPIVREVEDTHRSVSIVSRGRVAVVPAAGAVAPAPLAGPHRRPGPPAVRARSKGAATPVAAAPQTLQPPQRVPAQPAAEPALAPAQPAPAPAQPEPSAAPIPGPLLPAPLPFEPPVAPALAVVPVPELLPLPPPPPLPLP